MSLKPLVFDAETYYTTKDNGGYTLSAMTAEEYIRDPRFELIGFSLKKANGPSQWYSGPIEYLRQVAQSIPWGQVLVIGHNLSEFDALILTEVLGVYPAAYACTLQMARTIHGGKQSNSLANLATQYGLKSKGHQVANYINFRRADFTQMQLADYGDYCNGDCDICWDLFNLFVPQMPGNELWLASLATKMWAQPRLALDLPLLKALQADMAIKKGQLLGRVADILSVPGTLPHEQRMDAVRDLMRKDAVLAGVLKNQYDLDAPMKDSPKRKNPDGTPVRVYAFAKTDEGMEELLSFEDESDPDGAEDIQALAAARISVKSTLAESRVARFVGISERGLLPVPLRYGATHTHRLAGAMKINMQNLSGSRPVNPKTIKGSMIITPKGPERMRQFNKLHNLVQAQDGSIYKGKDVHAAGLRDCIIAPDGKLIVVVDSSQIELRVAHLLAGQMDTVDELRQGIDVYSTFASTIYGRTITKADHKERQHGKVGMLQLQYQSGAKSFKNAARIMGGVRLTDDEADSTVRVYRDRFSALPAFWWNCSRAIKKLANGGGGYIDQWGLCKIDHERITMPGRHPLYYHNLREELLEGFNGGDPELQWVYDDKEKRRMKKIYGGSMTENLCQWLARNVVFDQMLECEWKWGQKPGCGVVLTVHDEIVLVVDENDAEEALQFALGVMKQSPKWWPELPVAAEGGIGRRYSEAK